MCKSNKLSTGSVKWLVAVSESGIQGETKSQREFKYQLNNLNRYFRSVWPLTTFVIWSGAQNTVFELATTQTRTGKSRARKALTKQTEIDSPRSTKFRIFRPEANRLFVIWRCTHSHEWRRERFALWRGTRCTTGHQSGDWWGQMILKSVRVLLSKTSKREENPGPEGKDTGTYAFITKKDNLFFLFFSLKLCF